MRTYKNSFKKFGGEWIPDIVEYLKNYVNEHPGVTISVGCDSIQKRRKSIYACTIMMHDCDIRRGAHVVFFREAIPKERNIFMRLQKEAEYAHEIANFLDTELKDHYKRNDLDKFQRQYYKYHIEVCEGRHENIELHNQDKFISNILLSDYEESADYKLVDIHLDFNPKLDGGKNKSNMSYLSFVPALRGEGYRVWGKPLGFAATSAADLLLK